jgi:hypothetical protein
MRRKWFLFSIDPPVFHAVQPWSRDWSEDISWLTLCGTTQTERVEEDSDGDLICLLCLGAIRKRS